MHPGSQFIGSSKRSRYANLDRGVTKKFPSKWNNFTTGNSQLGEEQRQAFFVILTRAE